MIRPLRLVGDPVLRLRCDEVTDFDHDLRRLVEDLADTLLDARGAGLAAPQIGVRQRVFVYIVRDFETEELVVRHLVNPTIVERSEETIEGEEGCLSIPGLAYPLARAARVVARGFTVHGEPVSVIGDEGLARCFEHETDHLDGVLFIDRLDKETRRRARREIRELMLAGEPVLVKPSPHD